MHQYRLAVALQEEMLRKAEAGEGARRRRRLRSGVERAADPNSAKVRRRLPRVRSASQGELSKS